MGNPQDYQKVAAECLVLLRLSRVITDPQSKAMLLHMAASWIRLAERAKENRALPMSRTGSVSPGHVASGRHLL